MIAEERGYCVETDPSGDRALWRMTPAPHSLNATTDLQGLLEALLGAGKDNGISMRAKAPCQQSTTALTGWTQKCDLTWRGR